MPISFCGQVVAFMNSHVLVYGPDADAFGEPLFGPPAYLRPAYRLWAGGAHLLPSEAIDDIGQHFRDRAAYDWLEERGDAFPRADVLGRRADGRPQSVFVKELDLADLTLYAAGQPSGSVVRLDLALEALAMPDSQALAPVAPPAELALFERALPWYRLAPGAFGALGAALVQMVLASGRRDLSISFDSLDDLMER